MTLVLPGLYLDMFHSQDIARKISRGVYHGKRSQEKAWRRFRRALRSELVSYGLPVAVPLDNDRATSEAFVCVQRYLCEKDG